MGIRLRQSPSGKLLEGVSNGQVPVWNNTTREWDVGSPAGSSIVPLSNVLYVDGNSVAVGTPDGSIALPYLEIQDAIDAYLIDPGDAISVMVTGGFTYAALTLPESTTLQVTALGGPAVNIGNITIADTSTLVLEGLINAGDIDTGASSTVVLFGTRPFITVGAVTGGGSFSAFGAFNLSTITLPDGGIGLYGWSDVTAAVGALEANSVFANGVGCGGTVTATISAILLNSNVTGDLDTGAFDTDLFTLNKMRIANIVIGYTGSRTIYDAPTVIDEDFEFPIFAAPGVDSVTIAFPGAKVGDSFSAAPVDNGFPTDVVVGEPYCDTVDQVEIPIVCPTTSAGGPCGMTVTRWTTGPGATGP